MTSITVDPSAPPPPYNPSSHSPTSLRTVEVITSDSPQRKKGLLIGKIIALAILLIAAIGSTFLFPWPISAALFAGSIGMGIWLIVSCCKRSKPNLQINVNARRENPRFSVSSSLPQRHLPHLRFQLTPVTQPFESKKPIPSVPPFLREEEKSGSTFGSSRFNSVPLPTQVPHLPQPSSARPPIHRPVSVQLPSLREEEKSGSTFGSSRFNSASLPPQNTPFPLGRGPVNSGTSLTLPTLRRGSDRKEQTETKGS